MITNLYVLFTFHTNVAYRSSETGNDYFHTFAHHLQKEFMEKPFDKILSIIDKVMEVSYMGIQSCFLNNRINIKIS